MNQRWRRGVICALIAIGAVAVTAPLSEAQFFRTLNLKVLDTHFALRGQRPTGNIVLVLTDQKALDTFPELKLFWHRYYADAIRAASDGGAKVIGLDLSFGVSVEEWEPDLDHVLVDAVQSSPIPVVLAYVPEHLTNQERAPVPVNMLAAAMGLSAYPNLTDDTDGFIRRQELLEAPSATGESAARSLAFRVAEKYLGQDAVFENGKLTLAGQPIPIDSQRSIYINYAGGPATFPSVSIADVVDAIRAGKRDQLRQWFDNKIVLLGTDDKGDSYQTPFYSLFSGTKWTTPGVEIHANTVRTILDRDYLVPAPEWTRITSLLAATGATVAIAVALSAAPAIIGLLGVGLVVALVTHILFRSGLILSGSEIMVAANAALIGAIVYRFSTAERRGDIFHEAVSMFVSKKVAASLENSKGLKLSGKREVVTILFTDIRGFTAYTERICEEQGPEVLVKMLNQYMGTMASIIIAFGGHVNKFIGDGILAVFSDEDEGAEPGNHALRAVQCATRMVNAPSEFKTGAGLHTGIAVLGNVGSADKMEYTVLGDTVNLAARLESLNKEHKTKLLMSEATQQALNGAVQTTHLGSVPVRGKTAPIHLYTVTSLVEEIVHV